jgi:hypothetical protein
MKMTHTPGPWRRSSVNGNVVCDDRNEYHWRGGPCDPDLLFANACLIAAAPELLEGCKKALAMLDGLEPPAGPWTAYVAMLREYLQIAIARAEAS